MRTKRQPAGTPAVPAAPALRPGDRVLVTRGALIGGWGILHRQQPDLPGFWQVRMNNSDATRDCRVLAEGQLERVAPTPKS